MSYVIRMSTIMAVILFACTAAIQAATSVSPNITGTWTGSATGIEYKDQDNGTGGTTPAKEKASGTVVASIVQTGNDLSFNLTVTSTNSSTPTTFTVTFDKGKVGDFAFWATGVVPASDTDPEQQVFASGHFDAKPSKITGNMIFYRDNHVTNVAYTLKKTSSSLGVRGGVPAYAFLPDASPRDDTTPFNVAGSSTGKAFNFSTSAKAVSVKSTVNGTIDPVAKTATFTIVTGSNSETFNQKETDGGKAFIMVSTSGSDSLFLFGLGTGTGGAGIGWIYNDTGMTEFKYSVKKQ